MVSSLKFLLILFSYSLEFNYLNPVFTLYVYSKVSLVISTADIRFKTPHQVDIGQQYQIKDGFVAKERQWPG